MSPQTDYSYTIQRVASTAGQNILKDQAMKALGVQNNNNGQQQDLKKTATDLLKKKFGSFH
jgi:hypothetical protein